MDLVQGWRVATTSGDPGTAKDTLMVARAERREVLRTVPYRVGVAARDRCVRRWMTGWPADASA